MKTSILTLLQFVFLFPVFALRYEVGPGKTHANIGDVPLENLNAGDTLLIFARSTAYKEKWVMTAQGTATSPVVIRGMPDVSGNLPVIDGQNAVTRPQLNYWNRDRCIIKIGGSNTPPNFVPRHIIVENLEIKSARQPFVSDGSTPYTRNASAFYIEKGENITLRNCVMHDCGNGFFAASQSKDLLLEGNYIHGNGADSSIYEHNNYTESQGIIFQFNRFGPLRAGCLGNNLKDRSKGCVIRYNWIEAGNRQLDLVESDYDFIFNDPAYRATFVYGNILIEPDGAGNSQIAHYGGDGSDQSRYRKGRLYFYHNTLVSTRTGNTTLLRLSTSAESADIRNNILYVTAAGSRLGLIDDNGTADLRNNWLKTGWSKSHGAGAAGVSDSGNNVTGSDPAFADFNAQDFRITGASPCHSGATFPAPACLPAHSADLEYVKHQLSRPRWADAIPDIGAFEYDYGQSVGGPWAGAGPAAVSIFPNPAAGGRALIGIAGDLLQRKPPMQIFDPRGRKVAVGAGPVWVMEGLPAGQYWIRVETGSGAVVKKVTLLP